MKSLDFLTKDICQKLHYLFCDIDDTLTHEGKLLAESYTALWRAKEAGLRVVPVTGRPAGWCDHIARMWPVDAVIGENGGFYCWLGNGKMNWHYLQSEQERQAHREKLTKLGEKILQAIPGAAISVDQPYRALDLAIDFAEDVSPLPREQVEQIAAMFRAEGASAKISSIHVNGWFGDFDKLSTCQELASTLWSLSPETLREEAIFCGDSPNDEPMFRWFQYSAGVANLRDFADYLTHFPTVLTTRKGGYGFAELVAHILSQRGARIDCLSH